MLYSVSLTDEASQFSVPQLGNLGNQIVRRETRRHCTASSTLKYMRAIRGRCRSAYVHRLGHLNLSFLAADTDGRAGPPQLGYFVLGVRSPSARNFFSFAVMASSMNLTKRAPPSGRLTQLLENHQKYGHSRWNGINLNFPECELAISQRDFSEEMSKEERESAFATENRYKQVFTDVHPMFEKVFEEGTKRPTTATELLVHLNGEGGAFWIMAANLYERAVKVRPSEEQIRALMLECPPFHTVMLGLVHMQFEWSIIGTPAPTKKRIGKTDTLSAIYLPYCDVYVTNDKRQRKCFKEIASSAQLPVEVWSLAEFRNHLMPFAFLSKTA